VGLGTAQHAPLGSVWVIRMPMDGRLEDRAPVLYPAPDQQDVPLFFGGEVSAVVPGLARDAVAGFAISANFYAGQRLRGASATLVDADGRTLDCWLSTPEKPLRGGGGYKQILAIPKKPLAGATTYTITL
jgi:hypothetical protein